MGICLTGKLMTEGFIFPKINKLDNPVKFLDTNRDGKISKIERNIFYGKIEGLVGNNPDKKLFYEEIERRIKDYNSAR